MQKKIRYVSYGLILAGFAALCVPGFVILLNLINS